MKRIFTFLATIAISIIAMNSFAQDPYFSENFESYTSGSYIATESATWWQAWDNSVMGGEISNAVAHNSNNSMKVYINGSRETDVILNLNDITTGRYRVEFYMYVPTDRTGYYNLLQNFNGQNSSWGIQLTFMDGTGKIDANGNQYTCQYTPDSWTKIQHFIDLDNDWIDFYINDDLIISYQWSKGTNGDGTICKLDAIDFYSYTPDDGDTGEFYIDDLVIEETPAPTAPTNLTATVQNGEDIILSWDAIENPNLECYSISMDGEEIARTTETTYTHSHLYPMTYNYQVRAYCGVNYGYSAASNTATGIISGGVEREKVLIEAFSYRGCGYCPYAAKALDQMEASGTYDIIVLDHHISDTYGYQESYNRFQYWKTKSNVFGQVYGFTGTPSMVFDGYIGMGGLASTTISEEVSYIENFYNYVKPINSIYNFNCTLTQTEVNSRNFTLDVDAEKLSEYFGSDQVVVQVALSEDINYNWGVAGKISNLVRVMYPSSNGTVATFDANNHFTHQYTISVSEDYDISKCKIVAWVENHTQGRVMQSVQFKVRDYFTTDIATENSAFEVYPNPSNGMFTIENSNITNIEVYDVTGKLVWQANSNSNITSIDLSNYAKGVYTMKATANDNVFVKKLIVE